MRRVDRPGPVPRPLRHCSPPVAAAAEPDPRRIRRPARADLQARLRSDPARRPRHPRRRPRRTASASPRAKVAKAKRIFARTVQLDLDRPPARRPTDDPRPLVRRPGSRDGLPRAHRRRPARRRRRPLPARLGRLHPRGKQGEQRRRLLRLQLLRLQALEVPVSGRSRADSPSAAAARSRSPSPTSRSGVPAPSRAVARGVVVSFDGSISPRPPSPPPPGAGLASPSPARSGAATAGRRRACSRIELAFGARGGLDTGGLPLCPRSRLRNATAPPGARPLPSGAGRPRLRSPPKSPSTRRSRCSPAPASSPSTGALDGATRRSGSTPTRPRRRSPSSCPSSCARPRSGAYGVLLRSPVGQRPRPLAAPALLPRSPSGAATAPAASATATSAPAARCRPASHRHSRSLRPRHLPLRARPDPDRRPILRGCRVRAMSSRPPPSPLATAPLGRGGSAASSPRPPAATGSGSSPPPAPPSAACSPAPRRSPTRCCAKTRSSPTTTRAPTPRASPPSPCSRPPERRAALARSLVAYQLMLDYLDGVSERPAADPLANGLRLHRAFEVALDPDAAHEDYYALAPADEDGGYLQRADRDLPRAAARAALLSRRSAAPLLRQARLCGESQALNHALRFAAGRGPARRVGGADRGRGRARARASSGGSCSPPPPPPRSCIGALLALAATPGATRGRRPPGRVRLLPLGQRPERPARLARRPRRGPRGRQPPAPLRLPRARRRAPEAIAAGARERVSALPDGALHEAILAAMGALYLAQPEAWRPGREPISLAVYAGPRARSPGPRWRSTSCAAAVAAAAPCLSRARRSRARALVRYIPAER